MEKLFKKISILVIAMFLLLSFSFAFPQLKVDAQFGTPIPIPTPGTMIVDTIAEPETVDPHFAYDKASSELIFNVYDTLIFFNREEVPQSGAFELHIADGYQVVNPTTYRFHIRPSVQWQTATFGTVAPSDVEYSFERALIVGGVPTWMLGQPLLGTPFATDFGAITDPYSGVALSTLNLIRNSVVETNAAGIPTLGGGYIQFNLQMAYASFEQVLSHTVSSILSKSWAAQFTWSGAYDVDGDDQVNGIDPFGDGDVDEFDAATIFTEYNSPQTSPLDDAGNVMMGSGPYSLVAWTLGDNWRITRFANYYLGWPAAGASSFVTNIQVNLIPAWGFREQRFQACISDITDVPTGNYFVILNPNIRGTMNLPSSTGQLVWHWEKKWVQGWYYNPLYPGLYFYHLWKGLDADMSGDGLVYLEDVALLNAYWWDGIIGGSVASYSRKADKSWPDRNFFFGPVDNPPPGPGPEDEKADTTEMDDNYYLTGLTGVPVCPNSWEAFGIPAYGDGFVNLFDRALVNTQWFNYVVPV